MSDGKVKLTLQGVGSELAFSDAVKALLANEPRYWLE